MPPAYVKPYVKRAKTDAADKRCIQLVNMVRGLLPEFGIEMARGLHHALAWATRVSAGEAPDTVKRTGTNGS